MNNCHSYPGILAINLGKMSVEMVRVELELLDKAVAVSNEDMATQVIH